MSKTSKSPVLASSSSSSSSPALEVPSTVELLRFAGPALVIFLAAPLMSIVDTIFVGRVAGSSQLAALNPAVTIVDSTILLFSFLPKATTGLVSRALSPSSSSLALSPSGIGREEAGRVLACSLKVAFASGLLLLLVLTACADGLLARLLSSSSDDGGSLGLLAARYVRIRALSLPCVLVQNVALSGL